MPINRIIERFTFRRADAPDLVVGANVELDVGDFATLIRDPVTGHFPTVASGAVELQVATRLFAPTTCQGWLMIEADIEHARDPTDLTSFATAARFRVNDGANDLWWDGATWATATLPGEWNTEAEINANLGTLAFTARQIRIVVNLQTTDRRVAPRLRGVKLLWRTDVVWEEDLIYRTVLRELRAGLRPTARARHTLAATGTSFELHWRALETSTIPSGAARVEGGYDIVGIESVYDLTNDPNRFVNLASTFTPTSATSATVGLSASTPSSAVLEFSFIYAPSVALERSRDDDDVDRTPGLVISSVTHEDEGRRVQGDDLIVDRATGTAVRVPYPRQGHVRFGFTIQTENKADRARLSDEVRRFFAATPLIRSAGLDRRYTVQLVDDFTSARVPTLEGVVERDGAFVVYNVARHVRSASDEVGVSRLRLSFDGESSPLDIVGT